MICEPQGLYRLYRDDGLSFGFKWPRRNVGAANRERQPTALAAIAMWSMDFVSDPLFDGRRLRALTVVDALTCEALAIDYDQGIKGEQVVKALKRIALSRGAPQSIRVDNEPEFISKALHRLAHENGVTLELSRRGKLTDNAFVASFNGRFGGASASTPTGSCHWGTPGPGSRLGGGMTMRAAPTHRLAG